MTLAEALEQLGHGGSRDANARVTHCNVHTVRGAPAICIATRARVWGLGQHLRRVRPLLVRPTLPHPVP